MSVAVSYPLSTKTANCGQPNRDPGHTLNYRKHDCVNFWCSHYWYDGVSAEKLAEKNARYEFLVCPCCRDLLIATWEGEGLEKCYHSHSYAWLHIDSTVLRCEYPNCKHFFVELSRYGIFHPKDEKIYCGHCPRSEKKKNA